MREGFAQLAEGISPTSIQEAVMSGHSFMRGGPVVALVTSVSLILSARGGEASSFILADIKADLEIKGSYHTTVPREGAATPTDYNNKNTKIIVHYTIAVKTDPTTGKKEFDKANSSATFENEFPTGSGRRFVTTPIPITDIKGDAATGTVDSFSVNSPKAWDPDRPDKSNGLSGDIDLKGKKGNLKSSYTSGGNNPTITSYTFATDNEKPAPAKANATTGQPFAVKTRIPADQSIHYDAATGVLSIHDDVIVETTDTADPLLGAGISFRDFRFVGLTTDGLLAVFWPGDDSTLMIAKGGEIFQVSDIPVVYYSVPDNLFYAALTHTTLAGMAPGSPFFNPDLSSMSSPFLDSVADFLNPLSPNFDQTATLFLTIHPDLDFIALTDGFSKSGSSGADDLHFVAPEPSTWLLLATGCACVLICSRVRRRSRIGKVVM